MKRAAKKDENDQSNGTGDNDSQEDTKDKSSTNKNALKKINDSQTVSNGGFSPNTRLLKEDSRDDGFKDD